MKKRTLDEYRQTKEYQLKDGRKSFDPEFNDLVDRVMPEEIEEIRNKLNYTLNEQMQEIAERVKDTVYDIIFQEISTRINIRPIS